MPLSRFISLQPSRCKKSQGETGMGKSLPSTMRSRATSSSRTCERYGNLAIEAIAEMFGPVSDAGAGTVGGDDGHTLVQYGSQPLRFAIRLIDGRDRMLEGGVGQQRNAEPRHAPPERSVVGLHRVDVLAVGQQLDGDRSGLDDALELLDGILSAGMDRADRQESIRVPTDLETVVVGDQHFGPSSIELPPIVVDAVERQHADGIEVARLGPLEQLLSICRIDGLFLDVRESERSLQIAKQQTSLHVVADIAAVRFSQSDQMGVNIDDHRSNPRISHVERMSASSTARHLASVVGRGAPM